MKKINVIGERAVYVFLDSLGNRIVEFSTAEDYNSRFLNGSDNPPAKDGYVFSHAIRATHFDTMDGFIHENEYATMGDRIILKVPSGKIINETKVKIKELKTKNGSRIKTYKGELDEVDIQSFMKIKDTDLI